jgi:uncharacterized protein (TIGR00369 family)
MKGAPEPVHLVKVRRNAALATLVGQIPYAAFLGVRFDRHGDELTATLPFDDRLIGNPVLPALHGGAIAAFMEIAAVVELGWSILWDGMEAGDESAVPRLPKTIDFTVDYLRSGLPRDIFARARVVRSGRRYASVLVEAWQDHRDRPTASATGHFLMPQPDAAAE